MLPKTLSSILRTRLARILLGVVVIGLVALWVMAKMGVFARHNPLLDSPQVALEGLQAKSLYYNGRARAWLVAQRPDLLTAEDRDTDSERSRAFPQAVQSAKIFRQLDRMYRFDTLLLVGDPSEYRPLLDDLVEGKDFTLRYVDHTSMVFRRDNGRPWEPADLAPLRARLAGSKPAERAEVLAQTARKLLAIKQGAAAKTLLDEAAGLAPDEPHVANTLGAYYLDRGQWREASEQIDRALAADDEFLPAMATKTQLLYGMKKFDEAYDLSKRLIEKVPDDPNLLFYHAKIAHEAHAYQGEVATLETLIEKADALGLPVGGYRLYLGQAYAELGDAKRSVAAYMLALDDPELPKDQREYARESISRIKKRMEGGGGGATSNIQHPTPNIQ